MKKLALLLPGFLDSPNYLHMKTFKDGLEELGYTSIVIDPCNLWLWKADIAQYTVTNYIKQVMELVNNNCDKYDEIALIGHSLGGFVSMIAAEFCSSITKIIAICPPARRDNIKDKWDKTGFRLVKRDLPEDPRSYKEFKVPKSFVDDASQYSGVRSAEKLKVTTLIIVCDNDEVVAPEETAQLAIKGKENIHLVHIANMGHDFRFSQDDTNVVWNRIAGFLA